MTPQYTSVFARAGEEHLRGELHLEPWWTISKRAAAEKGVFG